jgi:predicted RNA-binding protein with PIN domain
MDNARAATRLLIDGHNLLYALRPRFADHLVDGHPRSAARAALVEALRNAFDGEARHVRIYFDGRTPHTERHSAEVEVIYPGGEGDQCADRAILRDLAEQARESVGTNVTVVTRDIKLAKRARRRGAAVVDPEAFFEGWVEVRT